MKAILFVLVMLMLSPIVSLAQETETTSLGIEIGPHVFGALRARGIGPAVMSGRISALDVVNSDPRNIYVGAASGGVWKSRNGGVNFRSCLVVVGEQVNVADLGDPEVVMGAVSEDPHGSRVSVDFDQSEIVVDSE